MLRLTIITPERRLVEGEPVEEVTLTTSRGQIQILEGHAAMLGLLEPGIFHCRTQGKGEIKGVISSGFFRVQNDSVHVVADTLELATEIDVARARQAQKKAEETLRDASLDEDHFNKYQLKLQRSLIRQQVASSSTH